MLPESRDADWRVFGGNISKDLIKVSELLQFCRGVDVTK